MNIETDPYVEEFLDHKPRSSRTVYVYLHAWKTYSKFLNKTPKEFIEEAKEEQISYIRNKEIIDENGEKQVLQQIIEPDVEKSNLAKDFKEFKRFKESEGVKNKTISNYFSFIRSLYSFHNVELPNPLVLDIETNPKKILKQEKIERAIKKASPRNKAIIALMASTGFRSRDVRYLKIKDLLKALDIETIDDLFLHGKNKIGYWEFKPLKTQRRNIYCKVCNTPYSTDLIINYLKERKKEKEVLKPNDYLFVAQNKEMISRNRFISIFRDLNEKLYYDDLEWFKEQLKLKKLSQSKYDEEIKDISNFHAHGLRAFFINTVSSECGNLKVVAAMEGHKSPVDTDKNYTSFTRKTIEKYYFPIIPFISFEKTKVRVLNEKRMEEYDEKIEKLGKKYKKDLKNLETKHKDEINEIKALMEKQGLTIEQMVQFEEIRKYWVMIRGDKHLSEIFEYINQKEDINSLNIDLLRELITLNKEKNLSKWKEEEWKSVVDKIIEKIQPIDEIDKIFKFENSKNIKSIRSYSPFTRKNKKYVYGPD